MRNDSYLGLEFDWLAVDSFGRLAVFSTAGFGPVSSVALATAEKQEAAIKILLTEHTYTENTDYLTSKTIFPFYIYDWKLHGGPYVLKKKPVDTTPATLDSLPKSSHSLVTHMQLDFSICESVPDILKNNQNNGISP